MRLQRDLSGEALAKALGSPGYAISRQTGSHLRLTTLQNGEHHVTIPRHSPLRIGTLAAILSEIARHFETIRDEIVERLFGNSGGPLVVANA